MKKSLGRTVPYALSRFVSNLGNSFDAHFARSYSQEGEDMVLKAIFHGMRKGFYVDIGAHHPKTFSNTYYFYQQGWRGINVDAMPGSMNAFRRVRKRDINIEAAISDRQEVLTYYSFNEPALNTFSPALADERARIPKFQLLGKKQIATMGLGDLLKKYMPAGQETIDFMTVDVEGLDLNVLRSNDWSKYRPTVILVESLEFAFDNMMDNPLSAFLYERQYTLFSKTVNTLFFVDQSFKYNTY